MDNRVTVAAYRKQFGNWIHLIVRAHAGNRDLMMNLDEALGSGAVMGCEIEASTITEPAPY